MFDPGNPQLKGGNLLRTCLRMYTQGHGKHILSLKFCSKFPSDFKVGERDMDGNRD